LSERPPTGRKQGVLTVMVLMRIWSSPFVLDLGLHIVNDVRRLHLKCDYLAVKGTGLTLHLQRRARQVSKTSAHAHVHPGSRGMRTCSACAGSRWSSHVGHIDRDARAHNCAHVTTMATTVPAKPPRLQQLQLQVKALGRVYNSPTSSGATSGGCARAHPPRT
jgi:hypothetical protein